ncbi:unnamed protein product [Linum trigynum]|uniref:Uncharacterized protein n=1 Tax=Linum trigynum TaxID=586398 RepID=A0AAV2C9D0_9ROSI
MPMNSYPNARTQAWTSTTSSALGVGKSLGAELGPPRCGFDCPPPALVTISLVCLPPPAACPSSGDGTICVGATTFVPVPSPF